MDLDFLRNKNVLVTGGTGLIGYNLVVKLLENSHVSRLFVMGRSQKKLVSTFEHFASDDRLVLVEHDVCDPIPSVIHDLDYIFHAAGPMERNIVLNYPVSVILPNILGTINLLDFLKREKNIRPKCGRLIVFSSVTVYANSSAHDICVTESDTANATSLDANAVCYSESKRMSEVIAKAYAKQYGVDTIIARFSTVYGYTKNIPDTAFYEFVNKAILGESIVLKGSGFPRRDNIYVDDAVDGLIRIAEKGISGEAYNISSGGQLNNFSAVDEIACAISKEAALILDRNPVKVETADSMSRKAGMQLDNSKLKQLGWNVETSLSEGVNITIRKILNI